VDSLTKLGSTADAAKRRVARAVESKALWSLSGVTLPHNESFVFLPKQADTDQFVQNLFETIAPTSSALASAIHGIALRGGIITKGHFPGISGCPDEMTGQVSHHRLLDSLLRYRLLIERDVAEVG